jgi:hypothetical protein
MIKLLFLDIDGVLNGHQTSDSGYCGIDPQCARRLNKVLNTYPDLKIVISSSWRYLIHTGQMTLEGFESLLLTHGVLCRGRIMGVTRRDHKEWETDLRINQINDFLGGFYIIDNFKWLILDDIDIDIVPVKEHLKIDGLTGLQDEDIDRIIAYFGE